MKLLRQADQARALGCSRWTVRRIAASDPTYPRAVVVSPGIVGVVEEDFNRWLRSRPVIDRPRPRGAVARERSAT